MKRQFLGRLVAVLTLNIALAAGALATEVYIADDSATDHVGRMIVVTNDTPTSAEACGLDLIAYLAVIVQGGPATHTSIKVDSSVILRAGDRFRIVSQVPCDDQLMFIVELLEGGKP